MLWSSFGCTCVYGVLDVSWKSCNMTTKDSLFMLIFLSQFLVNFKVITHFSFLFLKLYKELYWWKSEKSTVEAILVYGCIACSILWCLTELVFWSHISRKFSNMLSWKVWKDFCTSICLIIQATSYGTFETLLSLVVLGIKYSNPVRIWLEFGSSFRFTWVMTRKFSNTSRREVSNQFCIEKDFYV